MGNELAKKVQRHMQRPRGCSKKLQGTIATNFRRCLDCLHNDRGPALSFSNRSATTCQLHAFAPVFTTVLSGSLAQEREPAPNSKFSSKAESELKKQQARIQKELASGTSDEWSGEYYYGDGLGVNVDFSMAPKSGFAFT